MKNSFKNHSNTGKKYPDNDDVLHEEDLFYELDETVLHEEDLLGEIIATEESNGLTTYDHSLRETT